MLKCSIKLRETAELGDNSQWISYYNLLHFNIDNTIIPSIIVEILIRAALTKPFWKNKTKRIAK